MAPSLTKIKDQLSRRRFLILSLSSSAAAAAALYLGDLLPFASGQEPQQTQGKRRKWVMVIDLDRCDGCSECTAACIEEHMVPPAWGEPNYEGKQEWIKVHELEQDMGAPGEYGNFLPAPCMNCENAPCVNVCPVGATYHNDQDIVVIDHDRCIGCRFCMAACPYDRRYFNWGEPHTEEERAELSLDDYSPDFPVPHRRGTVEKCMFCSHRVREGRLPACVEACTKAGMNALFFGDAEEDVVSNGVEVLKFSELVSRRGGFRWKEELGTKGRVFYLPQKGGD